MGSFSRETCTYYTSTYTYVITDSDGNVVGGSSTTDPAFITSFNAVDRTLTVQTSSLDYVGTYTVSIILTLDDPNASTISLDYTLIITGCSASSFSVGTAISDFTYSLGSGDIPKTGTFTASIFGCAPASYTVTLTTGAELPGMFSYSSAGTGVTVTTNASDLTLDG